jgi:hypothetical protein
LVLGAATIGKDLQRNAEYAKIKQKFIDQWVVAYNAYVTRTGVPPGDSLTAPVLMVDGANYTGPLVGNLQAVAPPGLLCNGTAGPNMLTPGGLSAANLRTLMLQQGVRMPPGRTEGSEDRYVYLDTNGNPQEIQVCFQWNNPQNNAGSGNVMVISGLTPDLARMLDQEIDGKVDAGEGSFRQQAVVITTANLPGVDWNTDNRVAFGGGQVTPGNATAFDESQVVTVVAIYKMNQ